MKYLLIILKSIIVGFCSLAIPGLSASTVAILFGTYYIMIESISSIFKSFKESIINLISLIIGYSIGGFVGSLIMNLIHNEYPLLITVAVIGMILGCLPNIIKKLKGNFKLSNIFISLLIIGFLIVYSFLVTNGKMVEFIDMKFTDYLLLFLVGLVTSATLVVPGLDFALVLLSMGYYYAIVGVIANIFTFSNLLIDLTVIGTYLIGYSIGAFIYSLVIKKLHDKQSIRMEFANLGFVLVAPVIVIKKSIIDNPYYVYDKTQLIVGIIIAIILMIVIISFYHFTDKSDNRISHMKKRNMFRFYYCIISQPIKAIKYYRLLRKQLKKENRTLEEDFKLGLMIMNTIEKRGKITNVIYGEENIPDEATLIIANHQGRYDGLGIFDAFKNHPFNFIADVSRTNFPMYKEFTLIFNSIQIDHNDLRKTYKEIKRCGEELINGKSFLGFIEGKYEDNRNTLQEFNTGLLNAAYIAKCPITIVVLYDTWKVFGVSSLKPIYPEFHILKPIQYDEYKDLNKKELADLIKERMQEKLDEINKSKNIVIKKETNNEILITKQENN